MLSSQTKDGVTYSAMDRLKKHGLTIPSIIKSSESDIEELIYPVGFWKVCIIIFSIVLQKTTEKRKKNFCPKKYFIKF